MQISRDRAAQLGQETFQILQAGFYVSPRSQRVDIRAALEKAVANTVSHPPGQELSCTPASHEPHIEVVNETTLDAAKRLVDGGERPAALNFASAKSPGGGFLGGGRAQEESLARSSGLYACLVDQPMYPFHRGQNNPLYSRYAIYSPDVPVFRTDEGDLLDTPWLCSFITCAAVNAKVALERSSRAAIHAAMSERIDRVLTIAALHGHESLVLGAWGCGVFGNDGDEIAELFRAALLGPFQGAFRHVVFAVTDWSPERRFIGPFQRAFRT